MRMTKDEMIDKIRVYCEAMSNHLAELKIREGHLSLPEDLTIFKAATLKDGLEWIEAIWSKEYDALVRAKRLLTPDQWKRYELWGFENFEDHQEVIILRRAQVDLRKVLVSKDRPDLFKKGFVHERESVQKKRSKGNKKQESK